MLYFKCRIKTKNRVEYQIEGITYEEKKNTKNCFIKFDSDDIML